MKKPFTPAGLQELLSSLYLLPDTELQLEAATLGADLRTWLNDNFILSADQVAYLLAVDNRQIANAAADGRYFVAHRLNITLVKQDKPANYTAESEGKFFTLKSTKSSAYAPIAGYSEEESLTITIAYT